MKRLVVGVLVVLAGCAPYVPLPIHEKAPGPCTARATTTQDKPSAPCGARRPATTTTTTMADTKTPAPPRTTTSSIAGATTTTGVATTTTGAAASTSTTVHAKSPAPTAARTTLP